jgi:hypothetical protein
MKRIHIFFAFTLILIFSCEKEYRFQLAEQEILFSKDTVVFSNGNVGTLFLSVNVGNTQFSVNDVPAWLKISRTQGNVNIPGTLIEFSVDLANPPTFTIKGIIEIETPLGIKKITVIYIFNQGGVAFVTKEISIKNSETSGSITIVNNLNKTINWSVTYTDPSLSSDKSSGSLQVGDSNILKVTVNRSLLTSSGVYEGRINFEIDGNQYISKVFIENFEQPFVLDRDMTDVAYDKENGYIYFISTSPKALNRYHLANGNMFSMNLNFVPESLSLRQDNKKAIIGYNYNISEIDLVNMTITNTYPTGVKVLDVQLSQNDIAYIFSEQNNWSNLRWINLNSGKSYINTQKELTSGMIGQLHPNQKWLYSARKIGTDGSLEKFIIDGDKTTYSHDYRSNNFEFAILESVWFTESGDKMLSGNQLLACDEDPKKDMTISGKLPFPKVFTWDIKILSAAHSQKDHKFYISLYTNWPIEQYNNTLYVFDSQTLQLVKSTEIIDFIHNGEQHTPQLRYIFQNDNKIILIMKSHEKEVWAINQLNK